MKKIDVNPGQVLRIIEGGGGGWHVRTRSCAATLEPASALAIMLLLSLRRGWITQHVWNHTYIDMLLINQAPTSETETEAAKSYFESTSKYLASDPRILLKKKLTRIASQQQINVDCHARHKWCFDAHTRVYHNLLLKARAPTCCNTFSFSHRDNVRSLLHTVQSS